MSIVEKYQSRISESYEKIKGVYEHRDDGIMPFLVSDVNYWLSGETPDLIPEDYFTNPATMMQYQVKKIERHMEQFDDDYIPLLHSKDIDTKCLRFLFPGHQRNKKTCKFPSFDVAEIAVDKALETDQSPFVPLALFHR